MRIACVPFLISTAVLITACKEQGGGEKKGEHLYQDYLIRGDEETGEVTCLLQFRAGGAEGDPVRLQPPAGVTLDGQPLQADSAGMSGVFYEKRLPAASFAGQHTLRFTDPAGDDHREKFVFPLFTTTLPGIISRDSFRIRLQGLPRDAMPLRVTLTDTAFESDDFNEIVRTARGSITIPAYRLSRLKSGPIVLELTLEEVRPVRGGKRWGRLLVSYSLRREFELSRPVPPARAPGDGS